MTTIRKMLTGVQSIKLAEQLPIIIKDTSPEIVRLNRFQLYNQSVDKQGDPLRLYGSLSYALEKNKMNPAPGFGRPDLFLTGSFQRAIYVEVSGQVIKVWSRDSKADSLTKKYGEIFGMTKESKSDYAQKTVLPAIKAHIKAKSGLVFR
jgi:hypothetical protein